MPQKTLKDASNNVDTQFVFRTEKTVSINPSATSTVAQLSPCCLPKH